MSTQSLNPPIILLIDDNAGDVRLITEAVLAVVPYADVRSVADLILLDLRMPKKSGLEVLEEIRRDPQIGYLPVVVLTSSETEQDIFRAYALHANSVVTKPLSYVQLRSAIRTTCEFWLGVARLPGAPYEYKRNQDSAD